MTDIVDGLRENYPNMTDAFEAAREITRLRAELAAETKARKAYADKWPALVQERDALRALLREAREVIDGTHIEQYVEPLAARIDAALNKGDGDD